MTPYLRKMRADFVRAAKDWRREGAPLNTVCRPGEVGHGELWGASSCCCWRDPDGTYWRINVRDGVAYTEAADCRDTEMPF